MMQPTPSCNTAQIRPVVVSVDNAMPFICDLEAITLTVIERMNALMCFEFLNEIHCFSLFLKYNYNRIHLFNYLSCN